MQAMRFRGLTLVELLVVIAVIAITSGASIGLLLPVIACMLMMGMMMGGMSGHDQGGHPSAGPHQRLS